MLDANNATVVSVFIHPTDDDRLSNIVGLFYPSPPLYNCRGSQ